MSSKKKPLFLVFENSVEGGAPIRVFFKTGDDLRQDQLTLQVLRIMQLLWHRASLDVRLSPYTVVSTGDEVGMIEAVPDAETVAEVMAEAQATRQRLKVHRRQSATHLARARARGAGEVREGEYFAEADAAAPGRVGKFRKAINVFRQDMSLHDWLLVESPRAIDLQEGGEAVAVGDLGTVGRESASVTRREEALAAHLSGMASVHQEPAPRAGPPLPGSDALDARVLENFLRSCAGYCVATYVLGAAAGARQRAPPTPRAS